MPATKDGAGAGNDPRRATGKPDLALEKLSDTLARFGVASNDPDNIPAGTTVTTTDQWRDAVIDAGLIDAEKAGARRMRFLRLKEALLNRREICIYKEWVWRVRDAP